MALRGKTQLQRRDPVGHTGRMQARSVGELTAATASGQRVKYLRFWGHQPQRDGSIGQSCLSQWWPATFEVDGLSFATAEHYMMWRKAMLFEDTETAAQVLTVRHPGEAKSLGRKVRDFDEARWDAHRYEVVVVGNTAKFGQHEELRSYLIGTGDRVLVEASPVDRVWGIGLAADDPRAEDPAGWRGLNLLGFALMDTREVLGQPRA